MHPRYKSHTSTAIAATAAETDNVLGLCTVFVQFMYTPACYFTSVEQQASCFIPFLWKILPSWAVGNYFHDCKAWKEQYILWKLWNLIRFLMAQGDWTVNQQWLMICPTTSMKTTLWCRMWIFGTLWKDLWISTNVELFINVYSFLNLEIFF